MLPGVELARKRRIHHHGCGGLESLGSPRGSSPAGPSPRAELLHLPTSMAEPALLARRRLEEKLRSFGVGSAAAAPSSAAFSWRKPVGGESGSAPAPPRRGAPAAREAGGNGTFSAARTKKKQPLAAGGGRPAAAVLERVNSEAEECAVCLEGFRGGEGRQVLNLPCSHRYHLDCVLPWLAAHPHCPCCRTPVRS